MKAPPFKPPATGDMVGDYRVVRKLGDGGFGFVYEVERAGRYYALKVIRARELESWGQREINILRHVVHPNVVRFRACDRWPDPDHGYLCFVMDLVVGRTLDEWVLDENPTARQVVRVLLEVARALADILVQGVLHRDLKRENILIRDSDGRPVLVDFGIGWLAGEPTITGEREPPGTDEYRSPEHILFERDPSKQKKKAGYRPDVGDELWALGVTFYWLLTDALPFGNRTEGGLEDRILAQRPPSPHAYSSRVPPALSALCMRMLEKRREARFANYAELCSALEAALFAAEGDAAWDVPLMDPDAPDATPTVKVPGMGPPPGEEAGLAWKAARPRRGRGAARKRSPEPDSGGTPAVPAPVPVPVNAAQLPAHAKPQAAASPAEALVAVLAEVAPQHAWESLPPPVPDSALPSPPPAPAAVQPAAVAVPAAAVSPRGPPPSARVVRSPLQRTLSRFLPSVVGVFPLRAMAVDSLRRAAPFLVALGALAVASASAWVVRSRPAVDATPHVQVVRRPPPAESPNPGPLARASAVSEVANPPESFEAGPGAAFNLATTPAPVLATMLRKQNPFYKPEETPAPERKGRLARFAEKCVGAACCAVLGGCSGTPVRPTPKAEACSSKALATMKELEIRIGDSAPGTFPVEGSAKPVTVQESTTFELEGRLGELRPGTVLSGRLIFTESRVYGRFKEAKTPAGKSYPVCLELYYRGQRGVGVMREAGPDSAVVGSTASVEAVNHFE